MAKVRVAAVRAAGMEEGERVAVAEEATAAAAAVMEEEARAAVAD